MMPAPSRSRHWRQRRLRRRLRRQRRQSGPMFSHGICVKYLLKASFHSICWQKGNGNGNGTTTWPNQNAARQLPQILFAINFGFLLGQTMWQQSRTEQIKQPPTEQATNRGAPAGIIKSDISLLLPFNPLSEKTLMILPRHSLHF